MTAPDPTAQIPAITNSLPWVRQLAEGQHQQLCENFISTIDSTRHLDFASVDPLRRYQIDSFLSAFFFIVTHPDFQIPEKFAIPFIRMNPYISSLAALSSFVTTDAFLELLRYQPNNFIKILALYSARNSVSFDRRAIFEANATFASLWYIQFAQVHQGGLVSKTIWENLRTHCEFSPPDFVPVIDMVHACFGSTYVDGHCDSLIKPHINAGIQRAYPSKPAPPLPPPPPVSGRRKIAIISAVWNDHHSAPRICAALLRALKPHYHLTFFQMGDYFQHSTALFDDVVPIPTSNGFPTLPPNLPLDFHAFIYPDVGMSNESIILANQRLAPIQIALLGHSVSTFGAMIDYFISGAAVESPDHPERHYSEKLVLLPGYGCTHEVPHYARTPAFVGAPEPPLARDQPLIINCPWSAHKLNYPFIRTLRTLLDAATRPVRFRIFAGLNPRLIVGTQPLREQLAAALGADHVDLISASTYDDYMALMQQGHFTLDAHHFGGCNTVSDSLYLGIPMLCWQGDKWYNRIGPAMLRRAGLPELAATSEAEYLATAHRLIHDDAFRNALRARLAATDLTCALYAHDDAPYFLKAIDHLIENHDTLKNDPRRDPIRIS